MDGALNLNILLIRDPELRFQAMATVLHEGRHYTQYYASNSELSFFEFRAKRWKKNMEKYISSSVDRELYDMQIVERDAQKFAIKKMKRWQRKFADEEDFWRIYNNLNYRFEQNEKEAIEKYGKFYRRKIRKRIGRM